tara:strand:- start:4399 stop:5142 length:744 start_codon:yes stop_codon:yes gene_type:complete
MARTVGTLIRSAMRKAGILAAGEPLPAGDEGGDALEAFTLMVDAWSLESLLIPVVSVVTKQLLVGVSEYTIGIYPDITIPDNHIETARPEKILAAFIRDAYGTDYPQEVIDVQTFSRISRKTNSSRPSRFYNRKGWPLNTILFESLPYADETLHLEVVQPLSVYLSTAGLTSVVNLPPGYEQVLIYNLAIIIADEWGKSVTPSIATIAIEGKKRIKRANFRKLVLGMDRALVNSQRAKGTYIIESGP